jgi:hypothetical protein
VVEVEQVKGKSLDLVVLAAEEMLVVKHQDQQER